MDQSELSNTQHLTEEIKEQQIQENLTMWQSGDSPLTNLSEAQLDAIYQMKDALLEDYFYQSSKVAESNVETIVPSQKVNASMPIINTNQDYIKWMVKAEMEMKYANLQEYLIYFDKLQERAGECRSLSNEADVAMSTVEHLQKEYQHVTARTDSLHSLSEQLMKYQKQLKDKKVGVKKRLHYFKQYHTLSDNINRYASNVCSSLFIDTLNKIDDCLEYLYTHTNFKEAKMYIAKYENLLSKAIILIRKYFNDVITSATKQVTEPDNKANLLSTEETSNFKESGTESAFSLYYGKFQGAAVKVKFVINHIEQKCDKQLSYNQLLFDCQQTYFAQRSPVMTDAEAKALLELKNKHKNDYSMLFRSAGLFIMQVCLDEAACFKYFFSEPSYQLHEYFGILCQNLYDMLRPCLIGIYHLEVLTELCGILKKEMMNEQVQSNELLDKFVETIRQLLQDIEERLVFRSHIFFHNDLMSYQPSPGDLAYPEKLEQMENITEVGEHYRTESRSSVVSVESQEVATINSGHLGQLRSYTGNSPADLHGMWYPTVKRTLVCLSRLYFCLEREIFQGLAQEALSVSIRTIAKAQAMIASRKTAIDGRLFQIKHLLILREQIAPFQVDFTVTEVSLDFSNITAAAVGLIENRSKLFTFNSNNALLEFLLEGTPRVKEYLVDSRKEIDKQLKSSCEAFISHCAALLVGKLLEWIQKVENYSKAAKVQEKLVPLREQEFAKPQVLAGIINIAQRNIKSKIPEIQRSMQLYLANKETEFILFKPIKNAVINTFMQVEHIITEKYTNEDMLVTSCPSPEQVNILICSVYLTAEQDTPSSTGGTSLISGITLTKKEKVEKQLDKPASS